MRKPEFVTSGQVYEKYKGILEILRVEHEIAKDFNKDVIITSGKRISLRELYPPIPPSTSPKIDDRPDQSIINKPNNYFPISKFKIRSWDLFF